MDIHNCRGSYIHELNCGCPIIELWINAFIFKLRIGIIRDHYTYPWLSIIMDTHNSRPPSCRYHVSTQAAARRPAQLVLFRIAVPTTPAQTVSWSIPIMHYDVIWILLCHAIVHDTVVAGKVLHNSLVYSVICHCQGAYGAERQWEGSLS